MDHNPRLAKAARLDIPFPILLPLPPSLLLPSKLPHHNQSPSPPPPPPSSSSPSPPAIAPKPSVHQHREQEQIAFNELKANLEEAMQHLVALITVDPCHQQHYQHQQNRLLRTFKASLYKEHHNHCGLTYRLFESQLFYRALFLVFVVFFRGGIATGAVWPLCLLLSSMRKRRPHLVKPQLAELFLEEAWRVLTWAISSQGFSLVPGRVEGEPAPTSKCRSRPLTQLTLPITLASVYVPLMQISYLFPDHVAFTVDTSAFVLRREEKEENGTCPDPLNDGPNLLLNVLTVFRLLDGCFHYKDDDDDDKEEQFGLILRKAPKAAFFCFIYPWLMEKYWVRGANARFSPQPPAQYSQLALIAWALDACRRCLPADLKEQFKAYKAKLGSAKNADQSGLQVQQQQQQQKVFTSEKTTQLSANTEHHQHHQLQQQIDSSPFSPYKYAILEILIQALSLLIEVTQKQEVGLKYRPSSNDSDNDSKEKAPTPETIMLRYYLQWLTSLDGGGPPTNASDTDPTDTTDLPKHPQSLALHVDPHLSLYKVYQALLTTSTTTTTTNTTICSNNHPFPKDVEDKKKKTTWLSALETETDANVKKLLEAYLLRRFYEERFQSTPIKPLVYEQ